MRNVIALSASMIISIGAAVAQTAPQAPVPVPGGGEAQQPPVVAPQIPARSEKKPAADDGVKNENSAPAEKSDEKRDEKRS